MSANIGNGFITAILTSPLHPLLGSGFALITVEGRKSGRPISTPINVMRDDGRLTVVSLRSRTWWRNLRGGRAATLRLAGKQLAVRGEVMEAETEVAQAFANFFQRFPQYAKYYGVRGGVTKEELQRLAGKHVVINLVEAKHG